MVPRLRPSLILTLTLTEFLIRLGRYSSATRHMSRDTYDFFTLRLSDLHNKRQVPSLPPPRVHTHTS